MTSPSSTSPRRRGVTLEEVARHAKVSRATVSRIVNGSTTVDADLARRVARSIEALGYVPNLSARNLARRRSGAIALVVPEAVERFFADPFFGTLVAGIHDELTAAGMILEIIIATRDEKAALHLLGGAADGVILFALDADVGLAERLATSLPVVIAGRPGPPIPTTVPYVDVDNRAGARAATEHLLARTSGVVATVTGPLDVSAGEDRLAGFLEAHAACGRAPGPVIAGDFTARSARDAVDAVLDARPSGLFVANDVMALTLIEMLTTRGVRIPEDIAVAGFDDAPAASTATPPLTTVRQQSRSQGATLARVLLALIDGATPQPATIIPTELVVRQSS